MEELAALLPQLDLQTAVAPKTDWAPPGHMTQTNGYAQQIWPCIWRTDDLTVYYGDSRSGGFSGGHELLDLPWGERHRESAPASDDRICGIQNALSIQRRSIRPERRQDYDGPSTWRAGTVHSNHYRK